MALFQAKVLTREGMKTLQLNSKDEATARAYFARSGRVIAIQRKRDWNLSVPLSSSDRLIFFTRMAAMLSSRVGTSDALALIRNTFSGKIQEVTSRLLSYVEAGDDLASAIEKVGAPDFPEATIALIHAGSRSGETWKAIRDAIEFEQQLNHARAGAAKGLWVGIGSLVLSGALAIASTLYVGPTVMKSDLIKGASEMGEKIDIGWVNTFGNAIGILTAVMLAAIALMFFVASVGRKLVPLHADRFIMSIPYYKDLVLARNNFIVLYGLSLLVKSGVRTEEALRLSAEAAPKGALRRDLTNAMLAVKSGREWAKEMVTLHPTDKAALLSATDRTQIAYTLNALANQYRELYAQRLASFVPLINMLAAVFMALAGGVLFAESILPMLMASKNLL